MQLPILGIAGLTTTIALLSSSIYPRTFSFTNAQTPPADSPDSQSQRFKICLTLSSSTDLQVREGDEVEKGEVLADRTRVRVRLNAQKR